MTKSESALAKVQDLYALQSALWNVLDAKNLSPEAREDARKCLREFASLLRQADWQVMGGEDVYSNLKQMQTAVKQKLKSPSSRKTPRRGR